ncbi:MAG: HAD family hydrolase [Nitrospiraceae bacterium]
MDRHSSPIALDGFPWTHVDHVLLDMDGTLLDRHFDNVFFEEELPRRYAAQENLPYQTARDRLMAMYRSVEGDLKWTDLDYWSRRVGMDIVAMHRELADLIDFLPDAREFLARVRTLGKRITILTNAHQAGVSVKSGKTGLDRYVDRIVNAFDVGFLKMRPEYWPTCQRLVGFEPKRSLYIDDDESCLVAAQQFGIGYLVHRSKSSSRRPPEPSPHFPSIETLAVLFNGWPPNESNT